MLSMKQQHQFYLHICSNTTPITRRHYLFKITGV
ncbi:hypothetical protein AAZX31_14G204000 [Glycine max]